MRTPIRLLAVTLPAAALCLAGPARAQSLEDRLRSQLVSVTSQLRAAQSSQAELSAQKAAAEKERDALKAKLATAQRPRRSEPADSPEYQRLKAEFDQMAAADADLKTRLAAAQADLRRAGEDAARDGAARDQSAAALAARETDLGVCRAKNAELIDTAKALLAAYRGVTVADVLARREPLTGLKRVQFEQAAQDYGDRIHNGRLDVRPRPSAQVADKPSQH